MKMDEGPISLVAALYVSVASLRSRRIPSLGHGLFFNMIQDGFRVLRTIKMPFSRLSTAAAAFVVVDDDDDDDDADDDDDDEDDLL